MADDVERVSLMTPDGPICGCVEYKEGNKHYVFKGIPYAQPPLGSRRFMPPVPIQPWIDEKDCTIDPPGPLMFYPDKDLGSEDCLHVKVVTPARRPGGAALPVMLWVGSYMFISRIDEFCDPCLLVNEGVVFVNCTYRLGAFGFLSVTEHAAPGNAGLKDIVLALRWVQRNISAFGGDPANVTVFGNSSGGCAVHLLLLSPLAAGLFHKAVVQSGSALHNWALTKNPRAAAAELLAELGLGARPEPEVVEALKAAPAAAIMTAVRRIWDRRVEHHMDVIDPTFKPCIEADLEGQQAFLLRSPEAILKSGNFNKVPVIFGSINVEAGVMPILRRDFFKDYEQFDESAWQLVPRALALGADEDNVGEKLKRFYMGERLGRPDSEQQYVQLLTDYYYLYHVNKSVKHYKKMAPECPLYYYILNHVGAWALPERREPGGADGAGSAGHQMLDFMKSVGHGADIPNLFQLVADGAPCVGSRDAVRVRRKVVKMWTNFAKYGNPTPDDEDPLLQITWDPVTSEDRLDYLNIAADLTKGRNPFIDRMEFWDKLHREHTFLRALVHFHDSGVQF